MTQTRFSYLLIRLIILMFFMSFTVDMAYAQDGPFKINPFPDIVKKSKSSGLKSERNVEQEGQDNAPLKSKKSANESMQNEAQRMEVLERITTSKDSAFSGVDQSEIRRTKINKDTVGKPLTVKELNKKYNKGLVAQKPKKMKAVSPKIISLNSNKNVNIKVKNVAPKKVKKSAKSVPKQLEYIEAVEEVKEAGVTKKNEVVEEADVVVEEDVVKEMEEASIPAAPVPVPVLQEAAPTTNAISTKPWQALKDSSLLDALDGWSRKDGVTLVWNTSASYFLPSTTLLDGSYPEAVQELLEQFADVPFRPVGQLFWDEENGSRVLVIQSVE